MFSEYIGVKVDNASGQRTALVTSGSALQPAAVAIYSETDASNFQEEAYAASQSKTVTTTHFIERFSTVVQAMLASEEVLRREWDTPEEDAAWANL
jgi:hypothetical protein